MANLEEEKLAWESSPSPPKKDYEAMMNDIDDDDDDVEVRGRGKLSCLGCVLFLLFREKDKGSEAVNH